MKQYVITFLFAAAACSADDAAAPPQQPGAPAPVTAPVADGSSWRARVAAELAALDPARRAELAAAMPQTTRAGGTRFTTELVHDPRAAAVFIDRLARRTDDEPTRAALAEALPRTGGLYADAVAELIATEASELVRSVYVHSAGRAPTTHAVAILRRGFTDGAAVVRAEAARTAAAHATAGARLSAELRATLADSDPTSRAEAARALGVLGITVARNELERMLADGAADVRLAALRALDRIAPNTLAGSAAVAALANDPDERVARLAKKLAVRTQQP